MKRLTRFPVLLLVGVLLPTGISVTQAKGDKRNLIPEVRLSQDDINKNAIPFDELFRAGKHIYSNRFTMEDFFGEAPDGPRRSLQQFAGRPNLPYLRFNGLDAQTCFDCHFFIGSDCMFPGSPMDSPRQNDIVGGSAGFAANVFMFRDFPITTNGVVRNPPHTFGLGYVQRLAEEMSLDLLKQRDAGIERAKLFGSPTRVNLSSKGVSFGHIVVTPQGTLDPIQSNLQGVSRDLIVRPFQFKGIASTLRSFIASAMNFHFSVQPKELLDRGAIPNDNPNGTLTRDVRDEMLEGDVTSVGVFLAFLRPPVQTADGLDPWKVAKGAQLIEKALCTTCHIPTLRINDPFITIADPRTFLPQIQSRPPRLAPRIPDLNTQEASSEDIPIAYLHKANRGKPLPLPVRLPGYTKNLNSSDGPPETLPRLPYNRTDGSIDVPLFSDLKRHKMGAGLAEDFVQATDVAGIDVPGDEFLTRPLWGVCDTGPWLHDGRALSLEEAILMHEGAGSEANASIAAFKALNDADRDAIHEFLLSLRVRMLPQPRLRPALPGFGQPAN